MTKINKNLTEEQKEAYLTALCYINNIDKEIHAEKLNHFENQAKYIDFPIENIHKIKKVKKIEDLIACLKKINDRKIKRFILREMILLAISDHELQDQEIETIYLLGSKIGIGNEKVNDFFLWAAKGLEWQMEGSRLIEEDI